ncbi:NADPH-dependent FMN reductase [Ferruginivarius sediminum]|uniref:NADPH-dependent oxidoreductase n=1 Tax=Ferruginivarius sediminum TaxID=2661937 RepID=A0A369TAW2_9PROT|nr:NAD(P)H-dependent oxidoreductase [Ferruginivarius sediminum]RDD61317.1 NADPH-dependent oxidoreductase [Ferruginivarius sediminum]
MPGIPRILAFAGSTRKASFNKMLVRVAAAGAADAGAETTVVDLLDYRMPVYDGDLEAREGIPASARKLKEMMKAHDGLLIAAPEYNGSLTAVLKNTIDWVSRPEEGEATLAAFDGKVAGLLAASPGGLGGLRGLAHLRQILSGIRVMVVPEQLAVPRAGDAFAKDGNMNDAAQEAAVRAIGARVAEVASRLKDA